LLALLSGASLTLGFAPFNLWPVVLLALGVFSHLLSRSDKAFKLGFIFGLGWFGAGISWVHVSIAEFGGLPLIVSLALMLLLSAYLAFYPAFISYLLKKYFAPAIWPLALPLIWLFVEWLRSWLLTGFPWLSIGYSQISGPLAGWIPVLGETGLSAMTVMLCAALAHWLPKRRYLASSSLVIVLVLSSWVLNRHQWTSPTGKTATVAMVQGNIKQQLRWAPEQDAPTMQKYLNMTQAHWNNEIIIWPEAAIPKLEPQAVDYLLELDALAAEHGSGLITGIVNYNFETRAAYNNLIGLGALQKNDHKGQYHYGHANRFAKHHLLPIGEFIPMESWLRGLAPIFDLPMSSFSRGDYQQQNLLANGYHFAPALCFEIAFPHQISANLTADTDFILTVSNDAWFGHSHGPAQHLQIAQMRAKEFGLPVLRATNNGITAFINHKGQIQSVLPQFQAAVLTDNIALVSGTTPYRYFGDLTAWLLAIVGFALAYWLSRKKPEA
jgi:apolipoprotein N-acyltransferase